MMSKKNRKKIDKALVADYHIITGQNQKSIGLPIANKLQNYANFEIYSMFDNNTSIVSSNKTQIFKKPIS